MGLCCSSHDHVNVPCSVQLRQLFQLAHEMRFLIQKDGGTELLKVPTIVGY